MKSWQKWLLVLAIFGAVLVAAVTINLRNNADAYGAVLQANWGFALPRRGQCLEVYQAYLGDGFHGDGLRYHVFSCNDTRIESMYAWLPDEHATIYHESFRDAAEDWFDQLGVSAEQRPVYADCRYWYQSQEDNSELIVFWDEGLETLYVLESFL